MRFRHKVFGTVTVHPDPHWADDKPQYTPDTGTLADAITPLHDKTKTELQAIARDRGLPTSGTKQDLLERLQ